MSALDPPACFCGRQYTRADLTFKPPESEHTFTVQYIYDQEKDDHKGTFELLKVDSPEKGVYARFMVCRSASNKVPHVLNDSAFIPHVKCKLELKKEPEKKKGYYEVVLKIRKEPSMTEPLRSYFEPRRPSSSDEEK